MNYTNQSYGCVTNEKKPFSTFVLVFIGYWILKIGAGFTSWPLFSATDTKNPALTFKNNFTFS